MRLRFMALTLTALSAVLVCGQSALTPAERQANIDSFEQVWTTVRDKHWDPKINGVDWQAVHDELRPKVEQATTMDEARAVMSDMLHRLNQTHFGIVPSDAYKELADLQSGKAGSSEGEPGIELRVVDGRALVTSVAPDSPAAAQGVKIGWELLSVDGKEIAPSLSKIQDALGQSTLIELMEERTIASRLQGEVGKAVPVKFRDGKDGTVELKLKRSAPRGTLAMLGNLPPMHFWVQSRQIQPDIGYVRFNLFFEPDTLIGAFREAVQACRECRGFVIDLRGNPGGIGGLATGVAGWFIDQKGQRLGTMYMRTASVKFALYPRPEPFLGPLAVLVDGCSASTSEVFAGGMKDLKRARIFGTRTAGAALPSMFTKLPNGDGFQYAIANYISEGGQPLEGIGVTPDQEVKLTRHQLLEGQDPVLDAAVSWIRTQKN
ncbi:MAG TPA: S41 family peptidase [Bryobacteraceae bacterium]|nr:S41 family peptidase [Bryobacteraceae bacterium]